MRKFIFILVTTAFFVEVSAKAQTFASDPVYKIVNFTRNFSGGGGFFINEVDGTTNTTSRNTRMRDTNGNYLTFPNHLEALTYIDHQGWVLISTYAEEGSRVHYVFRRKEENHPSATY